MNKLDKPLARLIKKKREKTQSTNTRNQTVHSTRDSTGTHKKKKNNGIL